MQMTNWLKHSNYLWCYISVLLTLWHTGVPLVPVCLHRWPQPGWAAHRISLSAKKNPWHYSLPPITDALTHMCRTVNFRKLDSKHLKIAKVIFWLCFSPVRPQELLRKEKVWPTEVGHNSWWHRKCAQHTAHNPKLEKMVLFRHPPWWP